MRKAEVMTELANSDAHLYFTPAECDLRLGMSTVQDERNGNRGNISKKNANTNQMKRNSLYNNNHEESKLSAASLINH